MKPEQVVLEYALRLTPEQWGLLLMLVATAEEEAAVDDLPEAQAARDANEIRFATDKLGACKAIRSQLDRLMGGPLAASLEKVWQDRIARRRGLEDPE